MANMPCRMMIARLRENAAGAIGCEASSGDEYSSRKGATAHCLLDCDGQGTMRNFFNRKGSEMKAENGETETPDQEAVLANEEAVEENAGSANVQSVSPVNDASNKLMRLQADFDNYRRRTATSRQEGRDEARREMLLGLLPIFDNFLRALAHAREEGSDPGLVSGIDGIRLQFEDFFRREGLETIAAEPGSQFDPNLHDATGAIPGEDVEPNTIARELLKGFMYKGQVLRPAQVLVFAE